MVKSRKSRHFTLMLMPDTSTIDVRRIRISRRLVRIFVSGIAIFGLFFVANSFVSAHLWRQSDENSMLKAENDELRARLESLDNRLEGMSAVAARIQQFDAKLRRITMVSDPERDLAIGPVGGDAPEPLEARGGGSER